MAEIRLPVKEYLEKLVRTRPNDVGSGHNLYIPAVQAAGEIR